MKARSHARRLPAFLAALTWCIAMMIGSNASPASAAEASGDAQPSHVVLILTGGLRWDQIDSANAPTLAAMVASGTSANLVPLATRGAACPIDSWLAISAGQQVSSTAIAQTPTCARSGAVAGAALPEWSRYTELLAATNSAASLGAFARSLGAAGVTTHGIGDGSSYVLSADGTEPANLTPASADRSTLAKDVAASAATYGLTVVDADAESYSSDTERQEARQLYLDYLSQIEGSQADASQQPSQGDVYLPDTVDGTQATPERAHFAALNMLRVEAILSKIPADTRVVVASTVDIDTSSYMQMFVAADVGSSTMSAIASNGSVDSSLTRGALASSASVRREGVIEALDLAPTLLAWLGASAPDLAGSIITSGAECAANVRACHVERVAQLADQATHSGAIRTLRGGFVRTLAFVAIAYLVGSVVALSTRRKRSPQAMGESESGVEIALTERMGTTARGREAGKGRLATGERVAAWGREAWIWAGLTLAALPVASFLVCGLTSWWQAGSRWAALTGGSWGLAAGIALIAAVAERRWPTAPVAIPALTAVVIVADTATGSNLMADSPLGFNLLTAARFYGLGNEAYSCMAAGAIVALAFLAMRVSRTRGPVWAAACVGALGLVVAAVDAAPMLGADFGGVLSFVPALLVMVIVVAQLRLSPARVLWVGAATVLVAAAVAVGDWMRPAESRTHLGRFVQSTIDGEFFDIIARKLSTNLRLLTTSTHRWVVLAGIVLLVVAIIPELRRLRARGGHESRWSEPFRLALVGLGVCFVLAFLLNDSGIVLPSMAMMCSLPVIVSMLLVERGAIRPPGGEM